MQFSFIKCSIHNPSFMYSNLIWQQHVIWQWRKLIDYSKYLEFLRFKQGFRNFAKVKYSLSQNKKYFFCFNICQNSNTVNKKFKSVIFLIIYIKQNLQETLVRLLLDVKLFSPPSSHCLLYHHDIWKEKIIRLRLLRFTYHLQNHIYCKNALIVLLRLRVAIMKLLPVYLWKMSIMECNPVFKVIESDVQINIKIHL